MIAGLRLGSTYAGIRKINKDDLTIIEICEGGNAAAVFTQNAFCAAPVTIARQHLTSKKPRYLLINAGNANAGTGTIGQNACLTTCQTLADQTACSVSEVLPFSTGVIGQQLDTTKFTSAIPRALSALDENGWESAANAIMTTDTRPKLVTAKHDLEGDTITITGIAKGAGMIRPDMATMLAFIATDAEIAPDQLHACLKSAVERSFNRITIDGDTSTNDACVLIATGKSGVRIDNINQIQPVIDDVCIQLAQAIVRDGEGATKFITIEVNGGRSRDESKMVAYTIAHSPLVKTAFFASDPNWGRLLAAIGRAGITDLDVAKISISLGNIKLIDAGQPAASYREELGATVMAQSDINVHVDLNRGKFSETVWTCDFSYDYVRINAEYRT